MDTLDEIKLLLAVLRKALHHIDSDCAELVMLVERLLADVPDLEAWVGEVET